MLFTGLSTVYLVAAVVILCAVGALATFFGRKLRADVAAIAQYATETANWVRENNEKSVSLARIAEVECAVTELSDAYDALLQSHKKLRSRIGMRELRAKRDDLPPEREEVESDEVANARRKNELRAQARKLGFKI